MSNWIAPSLFLKSKGIKITAGMVLDPVELGMPAHPIFGELPVVTVNVAKDDGSVFLHGTIECSDCGEERDIEPGDWFQVRRCRTHQKRAQRKAKSPAKSEEEKAAAKAEREAKQALSNAEREIKRAEERAAEATKKAAEAAEKLAAMKAAEAEKAALIAKVAAEKGVPVSERS